MKPSPLQLESPTYPILSVRSVPDNDRKLSREPLPIKVSSTVLYDADGTHFAYLTIEQDDESFPYLVEIDVFASFFIDVEGCRQAYKAAFNPEVVAVNVARILYSGAREMLGVLTSRGPHGPANLPSVMIEPTDVNVQFERDKVDTILSKSFGFTPEAVKSVMDHFENVERAQLQESEGTAQLELTHAADSEVSPPSRTSTRKSAKPKKLVAKKTPKGK